MQDAAQDLKGFKKSLRKADSREEEGPTGAEQVPGEALTLATQDIYGNNEVCNKTIKANRSTVSQGCIQQVIDKKFIWPTSRKGTERSPDQKHRQRNRVLPVQGPTKAILKIGQEDAGSGIQKVASASNSALGQNYFCRTNFVNIFC